MSGDAVAVTSSHGHSRSTPACDSFPRFVPRFTANTHLKVHSFQSPQFDMIRPTVPRLVPSFGVRTSASPSHKTKSKGGDGKRNACADPNKDSAPAQLSVSSSLHRVLSSSANKVTRNAATPTCQRPVGSGRPQTGTKAQGEGFQQKSSNGTPLALYRPTLYTTVSKTHTNGFHSATISVKSSSSLLESVESANRKSSLVVKQFPATRPGLVRVQGTINSSCPLARPALANQPVGIPENTSDPRFAPLHAAASSSILGNARLASSQMTSSSSIRDGISPILPVQREANDMAEVACRKRRVSCF